MSRANNLIARPDPNSSSEPRADKILDSWKEIAAYLDRDIRTVQRWEKKEGLPVRRHMHDEVGTVYAFPAEIDEWRSKRAAKRLTDDEENTAVRSRLMRLIFVTFLVLGIFAIAVILDVGGWRHGLMGAKRPTMKSLAVLPLQNLSGDPGQDFFADSMTEELITNLSQISALRVISRTSVMRYKKSDKSLPEIARELNVDAIVEGSVLRSADRVHITAQLIYAPNDSNLWAKSYDREVKDVLTLQTAIASAIANEIRVKLTPGEQARLKTIRPLNEAALDAGLEGRYHLQKWAEQKYRRGMSESRANELRQAVANFELAIQKDPNYAPAYLGLSEALLSHAPPPEYIDRASAALAKAMTLNETGEAHLRMASLRMQYEWDWPGAEQEFRRALALNPSSADGHTFFADYLHYVGRYDEERKEREVAQTLDPNHDRLRTFAQAVAHGFRSHSTLEGDRQYLDERAPNDAFARGMLATNYLRAGRYKEAAEQYEKCWAMFGYDELAGALRRGYAKGDYRTALRKANEAAVELAGREYVPPFLPAFLYASQGDRDHAFAWLDKAVEEHDWCLLDLKNDPIWDPIRSDSRFAQLLRRVRLF